ncbi:MAG: spore cortex biosynthesis protein YabQ [Actinobacteria bacterium]|nr:spore cortex biosynthesis protein YabQ [Actinomycetota bacterium]
MTPLDIQFYNFSVMVLAGALIGLIYDSYRVLRMLVRPGAALTAFGDLLLLIGVALTVGLALLVGNWGDLRLYVFIGIALGLGLYYELASDTFLKVALWTLRKLIGLFVLAADLIYRAVAVPVAFLVGVLLVPLTFICRLAGAGWARTRVALGKVQGLAGPARSGLQQRASGLKEKLFGWLIGHKEG